MTILSSKQYKALTNQLSSLSKAVYGASVLNSLNYQFPTWSKVDPVDTYCTNGDIYAIIKRIAESVCLIPKYMYYVVPDQQKALKEIKAFSAASAFTPQNLLSLKILQTKALEDAKEDDPALKLIRNPNPYQNEYEFEEALASYFLACGEFFIWKYILPEGGNQGAPYEIYALNPNYLRVKVSTSFPQEITGYEYWLNGTKVIDAKPEDIIHEKTFNPQNPFRGLPPLVAGSKVVNRMESVEERVQAQADNGNLPGVIYDKAIPYEASAQPQLDAKRKHLFDFITNKENSGVPYYSAGELGFLATGLKLADLEAVELSDVDFGRACNLYKISARLFNRKGDASYNNQLSDSKNAFLYAFLPLKYKIRNALNAGLLTAFPDQNKVHRFIDIDVSSIPELQPDIEKMVNAMAALPIAPTGNEQRAMLKYDSIDLPWMNVPIIKSGYSFYDEVNIPPVDPNLL